MNFIKQLRLEKTLVSMCIKAASTSNDGIDRFFFSLRARVLFVSENIGDPITSQAFSQSCCH